MQSFMQKKAKLTDKEVNELLYYYKQGIDVGKEEATLSVINNLISLNMDNATISKIVNLDENKIEQLIG